MNPEPTDPMLRVGRLQHEGANATLRARLNRNSLSQFKLDLVVVARAGQTPAEAGLLFGSPSLFQRLYYSQRNGPLARPGEARAPSQLETASWGLLSASFSALIARPAYANVFDDLAALGTLVATGEAVFFKEKFGGNGRTCGTCHRAENNLTIDPEFIATLPSTDPLFVAEFNSDLSANFENPELMRHFGLICENVDGFSNPCVMRGVPHTLALNTSLQPATSGLPEMIGWSADGSPNNTLREFATGAVTQHFTKTLNRQPGTDFVLPTPAQLDALEAFQRSTGRQQDDTLPLALKDLSASAGQQIFMNGTGDPAPFNGTCMACHNNAGARTSFGVQANSNFNTGAEDRLDPPVA